MKIENIKEIEKEEYLKLAKQNKELTKIRDKLQELLEDGKS